MREEPGDARLRSRMLAGSWASSLLLLGWHAGSDVAGGDSAEIGGAAFSLGVAHPTGFALDMLLLRGFTLLPLGSIAWRQNLAVACISACALTSIAWLSMRLAGQLYGVRASSAALGAGLTCCALIAFRTFLASALGVEVYSTALLLLACAALVALPSQRSRHAPLFLLFGLAAGAHVTAALLMLPLIASSGLRPLPREGAGWPRWFVSRAVPFVCGAALIMYLPLASARDTAFDWGDPETAPRLARHLSAARIRDAYTRDMFAAHGSAAPRLLLQLTEHAWLCIPALLGGVLLWRRQRAVALVLLTVLSLDLGYAVWVNPMGIAERQLGHASGALLALLAGLGGAWSIDWLRMRSHWLASGMLLGVAAASAGTLASAAWLEHADGYAVAERYGSGSPLIDLPPRAVYLCSTDSACASALFAVYAEGVRPDMAVAPAQHLWDETVTRRLTLLPQPPMAAPTAASAKARRAEYVLQTLAQRSNLRALSFEVWPQGSAGQPAAAFGLRHAPWIGLADSEHVSPSTSPAEAHVAALERARFGAAGPTTQLARELWASAHAELGKMYLRTGQLASAVRALQRTVQLTPERSVAHSNLGVAFETAGDLVAALREARLAITAEPAQATAWVNLARLMWRMSGPEAARAVLSAAEQAAVHDARLRELQAALPAAQGSTAK
jgi:tetratricopeptide (TPR) repeat protein